MNQELGLKVLSQIMNWSDERARDEFAWLRLMARLKYDGYRDFLAGVRFLESLITWLQQFDAAERETAYVFVRRGLIYVGPAEIQRLVELFYPATVQNCLLQKVAGQCGIKKYQVWSTARALDELKCLRRKTLFMGLSDGARIDIMRHANAAVINNEQVVVATQLDGNKWQDLLKKLRRDLADEQAKFAVVYLIDDFMGTGTTFVRFDDAKKEWDGKLVRFKESVLLAKKMLGSMPFENGWDLCVHHYLAAHGATQKAPARVEEARTYLFGEADTFSQVQFTYGMVLPEHLPLTADPARYGEFIKLTNKYYDPIIQTDSTKVGGTDHMGLGYGQCALPLVLEHNTPNNSVALLWAETDGGTRPNDIAGLRDAPAVPTPTEIQYLSVMANPFEKRATEYLRDDEAFLAVVTPEPLGTFFQRPARDGRLYDRLTTIIGTPGSGKTTLARLFQYPTLRSLLRNQGLSTYKPLVDSLTQCRAISNGRALIVGCRLPLEAEYREFWEFPYPDELKIGLMIALLQARAVLGWLRNLQQGGHDLNDVSIVSRADADAACAAIGGVKATKILERARQIEMSIYQVSAALVAPDASDLDPDAVGAYRPLDVIESFKVKDSGDSFELRPLVIFDDAHNLHPMQLTALERWLTRREIRASRWMLMRLDALTPADVLTEGIDESKQPPGLKRAREITQIWLQSGDERVNQRRAFRKMAKDMANRYLAQMEIFSRRRLSNLSDLLSVTPQVIAESHLEQLVKRLDSTQRRCGISASRRQAIETEVDRYIQGSSGESVGADVRSQMVLILMERYAKRVPQASLFETGEDADPAKPITADSGVADGAKIQLMHRFDRPYYFGIDTLCDASSENAEQFLQLASRLVAQAETRLIRSKNATLNSDLQHKLLKEKAAEIVNQWDFPHHALVRRLVDKIATQCVLKSLEPNASLGSGANAIGVPQEDFDKIPVVFPDLARLLQFGVAYNALNIVPKHGTKGRLWCLIELGGVLIVHYGLSLRRGGFLERTVDDVVKILD